MTLLTRSVSLGIFTIVVLMMLSGCSAQTETQIQEKEIWVTDIDGNIGTNNLEKIQKITPFTIVVPSYLPEELKKYPVWVLHRVDNDFSGRIIIDLEYQNRDRDPINTKSIFITEVNTTSDIEVIRDQNEIIFSGIKVNEVEGLPGLLEIFYYDWQMNGISFSCDTTGYEQSITRKIVQSMIEK